MIIVIIIIIIFIGIAFTQDDIRSIELQIKLLDTQLKTMSIKSFEYDLAPSEIARRELLLENLNKIVINNKGSSSSSSSGGIGYIGSNNNNGKLSPTTSSSYGGGGSSSGDISNPLSMKDRSLTNEIIRKQDEMVLEIGQGVERLHNKALVIGIIMI